MKLLVAEDDPLSMRLITRHLEAWGHEILAVTNGKAALDILLDPDGPECAILDWHMPEMDGAEVTRRVRDYVRETSGVYGEDSHPKYRYIVMLTARNADEDVITGLSAGADDYMAKPFNPGQLRARLRTAARVLDLQSRLLKTQATLRQQATRDLLTGAWNRAAGLQLLERELARNRRTGDFTTVILGDVDHFKKVNDTYGHAAGDSVLIAVAGKLSTATRREDIVCRFGGEEFLVVLPGLGHLHAADVAARILAAINSSPIAVGPPDGPPLVSIPITISLGATVSIAGCAPSGNNGAPALVAAELLKNSDKAMYAAKEAGRNRFAFYPALDETDPGIRPLTE